MYYFEHLFDFHKYRIHHYQAHHKNHNNRGKYYIDDQLQLLNSANNQLDRK